MFRSILIASLFLLCCQMSFGQQLFSADKKQAFATVYLTQVKTIFSVPEYQVELLKEYPISNERHRFILDQKSKNKPVVLTETEQKFFDTLEAKRKEIAATQDLELREILKENHLKYDDYQAMLLKYKNESAFAREIQGFFK